MTSRIVPLALAVGLLGCAQIRTVSTLAGGKEPGVADGVGEEAAFLSIGCMVLGDDGALYVTEELRVRSVTPDGVVSTLVGGLAFGITSGFADGVGQEAQFAGPLCLANGDPGELLVGDSGNEEVDRRVDLNTDYVERERAMHEVANDVVRCVQREDLQEIADRFDTAEVILDGCVYRRHEEAAPRPRASNRVAP